MKEVGIITKCLIVATATLVILSALLAFTYIVPKIMSMDIFNPIKVSMEAVPISDGREPKACLPYLRLQEIALIGGELLFSGTDTELELMIDIYINKDNEWIAVATNYNENGSYGKSCIVSWGATSLVYSIQPQGSLN